MKGTFYHSGQPCEVAQETAGIRLKTQLAAGVWDGKLAASTSLAGPSRPIRRFGANDNPEEATVKLAYLWRATVLGISLWEQLSTAANAAEAPQIIILKLDDVTWQGGRGDVPVSVRWQRVTDFIQQNKLKASSKTGMWIRMKQGK